MTGESKKKETKLLVASTKFSQKLTDYKGHLRVSLMLRQVNLLGECNECTEF